MKRYKGDVMVEDWDSLWFYHILQNDSDKDGYVRCIVILFDPKKGDMDGMRFDRFVNISKPRIGVSQVWLEPQAAPAAVAPVDEVLRHVQSVTP